MEFDRRRAAYRFAVALAVAVVLVYGVGWERVLANLQQADLAVYSAAPVASALALLAGGEGTRLALGFPSRSARGRLARRAFFAASLVRNFLPAGNVGGGAFVAYAVSRHRDVNVSEALAGVASWEFLMMVASAVVGAAGIAGVAVAGRDTAGLTDVFATFVVLLVAVVAVLVVLNEWRDRLVAAVVWVSRVGDPVFSKVVSGYDGPVEREAVWRGVDGFFRGVATLVADRRRFAVAALAAFAAWLFWVLPLFVCLLAVGVVVSPAVVMVAVALSGFARVIPAPGGIGPVDAAAGSVLFALTPHPLSVLASALVLYRAGQVLVQVAVGGAALWTLDVAITGELPDGGEEPSAPARNFD